MELSKDFIWGSLHLFKIYLLLLKLWFFKAVLLKVIRLLHGWG